MSSVGAYCVNLDQRRCISHNEPWKCGQCLQVCPVKVYERDLETGKVQIVNDPVCIGCRICMESCPANALHIKPAESEMNTRGVWNSETVEAIHYKAEYGTYQMRGFGTMGRLPPHFDGIVVVPSQLASVAPKDKYREKCDTEVIIGEDTAKYPIKLKVPIIIAAMSFGALSREAKQSLAIGVSLTGSLANTGEGGMLPEEPWLAHGYDAINGKKVRNPGGSFAVQWSTGRWGVSLDYLKAGDAVEVKVGQGAKPGMGGHLLGAKVTEEVAKVRGIPKGTDALSPCRYYDVLSFEDLKNQIKMIRDMTDYKVPILLKLGPSRPYKDVALAVDAGVDAISIDGMVGGTGCSPEVVTQGAGLPTTACLAQAVRALKDKRAHHKVKLFALGGIRNGLDAYKAMAMGADGVGFGAAAEIALGCRACMNCHTGQCRFGVASNEKDLTFFCPPKVGGQRIANFINATTEEIKILTMLSGHDTIKTLTKEDIRALDRDTAAICGIKLVGLEDYYPSSWREIEEGK